MIPPTPACLIFALTSVWLLIPGMLTCYKKRGTKIKVPVVILLGGTSESVCRIVCMSGVVILRKYFFSKLGLVDLSLTGPDLPGQSGVIAVCRVKKTWYFY